VSPARRNRRRSSAIAVWTFLPVLGQVLCHSHATGSGNPAGLDVDDVQPPGQILQECQVRPGVVEGVGVEDDGPEVFPGLKVEAKVSGRGATNRLGRHDDSMSCIGCSERGEC